MIPPISKKSAQPELRTEKRRLQLLRHNHTRGRFDEKHSYEEARIFTKAKMRVSSIQSAQKWVQKY